MKKNGIKFFLLLLLIFPFFVGAKEYKDDFLSDLLKLDISELEAPSVHSEHVTKEKKNGKRWRIQRTKRLQNCLS